MMNARNLTEVSFENNSIPGEAIPNPETIPRSSVMASVEFDGKHIGVESGARGSLIGLPVSIIATSF